MSLGKVTEDEKFSFDVNTWVNSKEEKVLGIAIDNAGLFDSHIKEGCKKASQKLPKLSRLVK